MDNDVYMTVKDCRGCRSTRGTTYKNQKNLKMFSESGLLDVFAMEILGTLPKTNLGRHYIFVITDRYEKFTRAVPTAKTTASHIESIFLDSWVIPYGIPKYFLIDSGTQLLGMLFTELCGYLGVKKLETTEYDLQTNVQTERYNKNIVNRILQYVDENKMDWDTYMKPLTYTYNTQVHISTNVTTPSLVLSRKPPRPSKTKYKTEF